jgi:hypothetical protein
MILLFAGENTGLIDENNYPVINLSNIQYLLVKIKPFNKGFTAKFPWLNLRH